MYRLFSVSGDTHCGHLFWLVRLQNGPVMSSPSDGKSPSLGLAQ